MTLPDFVKAFWHASMSLGQRVERTPWGAVASDDRFPMVWDANNAAVLEPCPGLKAEEIERTLHPILRTAGAPHEHVEFWESSVDNPALSRYRGRGGSPAPDMVMVFEGPLPDLPDPGIDIGIEEIAHPRRSFWPWFRDSLGEFGTELSGEVLDQLVRRVRAVFLPAGMRWFVGSVQGEPAGYASIISLGGVGYIDNVVTMPAQRRRGVATSAVAAAVAASERSGDAHVFLLAERDGDPRRLYERLGFRVAAAVESFTRLLEPEPHP